MNLNILTLLLAVILLSACTSVTEFPLPKSSSYRVTVTQPQSANFVLQDLVSDGVFTQGIEGPAVDQRGNLYAVN